MMVTIIGRGHGGTRAMSHTLTASGVYMGGLLNTSGDLVPPDDMYEACRVMAKYVKHNGGLSWDFSELFTMAIDPEFTRLVESYLSSVLSSGAKHKGWKLPETTLVYPWITRMFPDINYIIWTRDPRDSILGAHKTDDLADFCVPYDPTDDPLLKRAISWKYQRELIKATPPPARFIDVRFEDFVLDQDATLKRLEEFLGIPMGRIIVNPNAVDRWKRVDNPPDFDFLREDIIELGYELSK